jgi:hypothetical protein
MEGALSLQRRGGRVLRSDAEEKREDVTSRVQREEYEVLHRRRTGEVRLL